MGALTTGDPNSLLTYTSPSTKWVRNASGIYVSGTTLRCDHLADGTALGLLIEGQRTNVILRSQDMSHAAWTKADSTITADATASPDGTANADLVTEGTAGTGLLWQAGTATTASVQVSGSIFLKAGANITWARVVLTDSGATTGVNVWVDLATGAIGTVSARASATSVSGYVEAAANGFWRVVLTATFQSGVSNARIQVCSAASDTSLVRVNNAAYYAWQAYAGLGGPSISPIVTTSAAVTRAADDIKILLSQLPFDATKGTLLAKVRPLQDSGSTFVAANLREGSGSEIALYHTTTRRFLCRISSVTQAQLDGPVAAANTVNKVAASWKANDFAASFNGGSILTDTSGSLPTPTTLYLGSLDGTSSHLEGWLQQLIYLPRDMSDSELVAWSTL